MEDNWNYRAMASPCAYNLMQQSFPSTERKRTIMDLSHLNIGQLRELSEQVEKQLVRAVKREREEAVEQIMGIAHSMGMPIHALLEKIGPIKARKSTKPTTAYRHPDNPSLEWSGRGPRPRWVKEAVESGKNLEDFRQAA
jgi:DNA-binding protein H-NS